MAKNTISTDIVGFPRSPDPGSAAWRQARGLMLISDHVRIYSAQRAPRDRYSIPMPNDLVSIRSKR